MNIDLNANVPQSEVAEESKQCLEGKDDRCECCESKELVEQFKSEESTEFDFEKLRSLDMENLQDVLQVKLNTVNEKVNEMDDPEKLSEFELVVDAKQKEFDDYLRDAEYELMENVEFEGKTSSKNDIARRIIYHLNRVEQDFQYCLGLHGLVLFWKNISQKTTIPYGTYDSTLRILGSLKYKGDSEWVDILTVNNYMAEAHDPYLKDRVILMTLAEMRNSIVSRMQLVTKNPTDVAE